MDCACMTHSRQKHPEDGGRRTKEKQREKWWKPRSGSKERLKLSVCPGDGMIGATMCVCLCVYVCMCVGVYVTPNI